MEQDTILGGIPMQLVQRCAMYVNTLHTRQPSNYEDILWHKETMVTIMAFEDTRNVLSSWKSAWRRKTKDESLIVICGMILAAEILKANYKVWGARYPGGFNAASKMLEGHSVQDSTRLMRIFMVGQAVGDPNLARLIDGIFDPNQPWGRQG